MPTPVGRTPSDPEAPDAHSYHGNETRRPMAAARPASSHSGDVCLVELEHGARIVSGNSGEHALVLQLLVQSRQIALADDFQSRLDEPNYRPSDRLLLRRNKT